MDLGLEPFVILMGCGEVLFLGFGADASNSLIDPHGVGWGSKWVE